MTDVFRTALVGYGLAGAGLHAPLIAAADGLELSAVVTSGHRAEAQRDHPGAVVLDSAEELWAGEHDLVVVAAPNRAHAELARAAIEHAVPVVVDKPLAPTLAVGEALVAQAREAGVPLGVFQNRRQDEDFLAVREAISSGSLGAVARLDATWDRWRPEVASERWRESADPADAGGLLFDLGSHMIDQAIVLFGPPVSVYAEVDRRRAGALVDDDTFVALRFAGGEVAHLSATMLGERPRPRFRVTGTQGVHDSGDGGESPGLSGDFYTRVAGSLRAGEPLPVTGDDGLAVLRVIDAAQRSARDGAVVAL